LIGCPTNPSTIDCRFLTHTIDVILRLLWIFIPLHYIKVIYSDLECFLISRAFKLVIGYPSVRVKYFVHLIVSRDTVAFWLY